MRLHLNPIGGLAGDMFCAALLDARPELLDEVRSALAALHLPVPVDVALEHAPGVLSGKRFRVRRRSADMDPGHGHTAFRDIRRLLEDAPLDPGVRRRALAVFTLLAEAEGRVHGVNPAEVSFHEVGAWDSIADIVAAAVLLEGLDVSAVSSDPLPLGGGRVHGAHGLLPVPAPATALLLEGLPVVDDGIGGERVTPTGAAILRSLWPGDSGRPGGVLRASGRGFGTRALDGVPNCLQVLCLEAVAPITEHSRAEAFRPEADRVVSLRFEVDDQSPEDFALALDHLRDLSGVLSVTTVQGIGKRGRPTMGVEVLARPGNASAVAEACFRETSTIGLRWQQVDRLVLTREQRRVDVDGRAFEVKVVERPGGTDAKVELRDLSGVTEHERRRVLAEAVRRTSTGSDHE